MTKPRSIWKGLYEVGGFDLSHRADCCVYLVEAGDELVMIDSGAGPSLDRIIENVKKLGLDPNRIKHVIATHCHIDHIGGLARLKELYGAQIVAHERDAEGIELGESRLTAANLYGLVYDPVKIDLVLEKEHETHTLGGKEFHFVHIPGHTPGSIAVYLDMEEGRVLFGQDIHGPFSDNWGSDIDQWAKSMETLLNLEADLLCEGHAGVFKGRKVNEYIKSQLKTHGKL